MEIIALIILLVIAIPTFLLLQAKSKANKKKKQILSMPFPDTWKSILGKKVLFYKNLSTERKTEYENRIKEFLAETRITGVRLEITDEIKMLVASSAIIPVFAYPEWEYVNLGEVLVYDGLVNTRIDEDEKNNILGQVRPFQTKHILLLSKQNLERGFESMSGKENVGLHEFAHIIDEADGDIDGIPRVLMPKDLISHWINLMYKEIEKIRKGKSDINPYGLTNEAEFFAVVTEYFLENPEKFQKKHEKMYEILNRTFKRKTTPTK